MNLIPRCYALLERLEPPQDFTEGAEDRPTCDAPEKKLCGLRDKVRGLTTDSSEAVSESVNAPKNTEDDSSQGQNAQSSIHNQPFKRKGERLGSPLCTSLAQPYGVTFLTTPLLGVTVKLALPLGCSVV
jgi:hypothetical protein